MVDVSQGVRRVRVVVLCLLLVLAPIASTVTARSVSTTDPGGAGTNAVDIDLATNGTIVVAKNGTGDYRSIQNAIDNASDGTTIEVRSGTYREKVTLGKNVTLVAPDGATLNGSTFIDGSAITIPRGSHAAPTIDGFAVEGYDGWGMYSLYAWRTNESWTLRDSTLEGGWVYASYSNGSWRLANVTVRNAGVGAGYSNGNWTLRNVTIRGSDAAGVNAFDNDGAWAIEDSVVVNSAGEGVWASESSDDSLAERSKTPWLIEDSVVRNNGGAGVYAWRDASSWTVRNTSIRRNGGAGIYVSSSSGNWTVRRSTIRNNSIGIYAYGSTGAWRVRRSTVANNSGRYDATGIDAREASIRGNAIRNWWGQLSGPADDQCLGNVTCADWLLSPPGVNGTTTVAADGSGDYRTIRAALDNATDGDTIAVLPGTYTEQVTVGKNVTLTAPKGATLDGANLTTDATTTGIEIRVGGNLTPAIRGFTITGYDTGIDAAGTAGNWTVAGVTLKNNTRGMDLRRSTGSWTVRGSTVRDSGGDGIDAARSDGVWTIRGVIVRDNTHGVDARNSSGEWTIRRSTVRNNSDDGIDASDSGGGWAVHNSTITDNGGAGIRAGGAAAEGNATRNWWGRLSGPTDSQCDGNVDCGDWLFSSPGGPTVLPVDKDAEPDNYYRTIQNAADNASRGDTIRVASDRYNETVEVTASVTIVGDPGDASRGPAPDAPNVTAFVLKARGAALEGIEAEWIDPNANGLSLRHVRIRRGGFDARGGPNGVTIRNSTIEGEVRFGSFGTSVRGTTIVNNTLENVRFVPNTLRNTYIAENDMDSSLALGISIQETRLVGLTVTRNVIDGLVRIRTATAEPGSGKELKDVEISNNSIRAGGFVNRSIYMALGSQFEPRGKNKAGDIEISGNVLTGGEPTVLVSTRKSDVTGLRIRNNSFRNPDGSALSILTTRSRGDDDSYLGTVEIRNNSFANAGRGVTLGVKDADGDTAIEVLHNRIRNGTSTGDVGIAIQRPEGIAVTLRRNALHGFDRGVEVKRPNRSVDIAIRRNRLSNLSTAVRLLDPSNESHGDISVDGIGIHENNIRDATVGVANDDDEAVNATRNYWGAADGPSSNTSGALEDPATGALAGGSGAAVTGDSETGIANVRFDPYATEPFDYEGGGGVEVGNGTPTAAFTYAPTNATLGTLIRFNASTSTDDETIERYEWRFGDGTTATGVTVSHTYGDFGNYTVALTVTDNRGLSDTTKTEVSVAPNETLIVDADGEVGSYTEIQPAVDDASDEAKIVVRPGTYREEVVVSKNVTIVAPEGAMIDGTDLDDDFSAFQILPGVSEPNAPTIRGFVITGFETGINADSTRGAWLVANTTILGAETGIDVQHSRGNWSLHSVAATRTNKTDGSVGVAALNTSGDWTVSNGVFLNFERGISAGGSGGPWTIDSTLFQRVDRAVSAEDSTGDWTVTNSRVREARTPVYAADSTGNWTVADISTLDVGSITARRSGGDWTVRDLSLRGGGIDAAETAGDWAIREVTITDSEGPAVNASGSTGAWRIEKTEIVRGDAAGVAAVESTGDWKIANTTVVGVAGGGIDVRAADGNWQVTGSIVGENAQGIRATDTTGDWSVQRTLVKLNAGAGIRALSTDGRWRISGSILVANGGAEINAIDAAIEGDATDNYFDGDPSTKSNVCIGNVDCSDHLIEAPLNATLSIAVFFNRTDEARQRGANVDVYLLENTPTNQSTLDHFYEAESLDTVTIPDGTDPEAVLEAAAYNATTGANGTLRFSVQPEEYLVVFVPPAGDELNIEYTAVETYPTVETEVSRNLTDTYLDGIGEALAGFRRASEVRIGQNQEAAKSTYSHMREIFNEKLEGPSLAPKNLVPGMAKAFAKATTLGNNPGTAAFNSLISKVKQNVKAEIKQAYVQAIAYRAIQAHEVGEAGRMGRYMEQLNDSFVTDPQFDTEIGCLRWNVSGGSEPIIECDGYDEFPTENAAETTIANGSDRFRRIAAERPNASFDHAAVREVIARQRRAMLGDSPTPGAIYTPEQNIYLVAQTKAHVRDYNELKRRFKLMDQNQAFFNWLAARGAQLATQAKHPGARALGRFIQVLGKGAVAAYAIEKLGIRQQLVDQYLVTHQYYLRDTENVGRVNTEMMDWLANETEDPRLGDINGSISVDFNGTDIEYNGTKTVVIPNDQTDKYLPVAVHTDTVTITNTGNVTATPRFMTVTYYTPEIYTTKVSDASRIVPGQNESLEPLDPGETRTYEIPFKAIRHNYPEISPVKDPHRRMIAAFLGPKLIATRSSGTFHVAHPNSPIAERRTSTSTAAHSGTPARASLDGSASNGSVNATTASTPINTTLTPGGGSNDATARTVVETNDSTTIARFELIAPPGEDVDLSVRDGQGRLVGETQLTGDDVIRIPKATYTGSDGVFETIVVRNASNRSFTLTARAEDLSPDESVQVSVEVMEIPTRPASLGVYPLSVGMTARPGTNRTQSIVVAETGGQQPLGEVTMTTGRLSNGDGTNLSVSAVGVDPNNATIKANERRSVFLTVAPSSSFNISDDQPTRFSGTVAVESKDAGRRSISLSVLVFDSTVPGVELESANESVEGIHLARENVPSTANHSGTKPGNVTVTSSYRLHTNGSGTVTLSFDVPETGNRDAYIVTANGGWRSLSSSNVSGPLTVDVPAGSDTDRRWIAITKQEPECIEGVVTGTDDTISLTEIQQAINWWAEGIEVPDTGGETVSLSEIQSLINAWAEGTTVSCG